MKEYTEVTDQIEVPKNVGEEGFMRTLKALLRTPRIQQITINAAGTVSYSRLVREEDPSVPNVGVDFEDLVPAYVLRNADVMEVAIPEGSNAAVVLAYLFQLATSEQLSPFAFVTGMHTRFYRWFWESTGFRWDYGDRTSTVYGMPLLRDKDISDSALILCATFGREASLVDVQRGYEIEMESLTLPTDVEVF